MKLSMTLINELVDWMRAIAPQARLSSDSRTIAAGDIFFAFPIPGTKGDGRQHIQKSIEQGAAAVIYDSKDFVWNAAADFPHKAVQDLIQEIGLIANCWFQAPDKNMLTVAVTGTNGKTSCSQWIAKALSTAVAPCAVVGTLGVGTYRDGSLVNLEETGFTTPDALQLQRKLAQVAQAGAQALAIEASSIGLHQGRLNGLHFDIALFTNLTRDHLDYHGTMEAYAKSKEMLFTWPGLQASVINLDDEYGITLASHLKVKTPDANVVGYAIDEHEVEDLADLKLLKASQLRTTHSGTTFYLDSPYGSGNVKTQMIGRFNVSNVLGVMGVLLAHGISWERTVACIEKLSSVPGRMQQLGSAGQAMVVVDYAHTPDALEKTLQALQPIAQERQGELWCVFGCGGDRDPGKRPQMGRIAQIAQHAVVTSDNPRNEEPGKIIQDIVQGMSGTPHAIEDRASAILFAVKHAKPNDVVLIAGKGHETYQDIKGKKWPFSDEEHARLALATVATNNTMRRST